MRVVSPKRRRKGSKRLDTTDLRSLLEDKRLWVQLAIVAVPDGASSHFVIEAGQVLVDVETVPRGLDLRCRLGVGAGGVGQGLWRVPAPGTEVAVLVPDGQIEFSPMIVACLDSGAAPDRASDTRTILVATDAIEITAPSVIIGPGPDGTQPLIDGVVTGQAVDPFTGLQQWQLGGSSRSVRAKK